jgi:hypothetical protein
MIDILNTSLVWFVPYTFSIQADIGQVSALSGLISGEWLVCF